MSIPFHVYDIKANYIETKLRFLLPDLENKKDGLDNKEFLNVYHTVLMDYCRLNLEQPYPDPIVIPSTEEGPFTYFASMHIIICPINEIDPFLDYQLKKYDRSQEEFIGIVEFFIINAVKKESPRSSEDDRITIIREWIKHYRVGYHKPSLIEINENETKIMTQREIQIKMADEMIGECLKKLKLHFDNENLENFEKLLHQETIDNDIIFQGNAGILIDVFAQIKEKKLIVEDKAAINRWICKNFKYKKNDTLHPFDPEYVKNTLTLQNTPSKQYRVLIDFPVD